MNMKKLLPVTILGLNILGLVGCGTSQTENLKNQIVDEFGVNPTSEELFDFVDYKWYEHDTLINVINVDSNGNELDIRDFSPTEWLNFELTDWDVSDEISRNLTIVKTLEAPLTLQETIEDWLQSYSVSGGMFNARIATFVPYVNDGAHMIRIVLESTFSAGLRSQNEKERAMINLAVNLAEQDFGISTIGITVQENNSSTNNTIFNSAFAQFNSADIDQLKVVQEYMKFVDFETGDYIDWVSNN